MTTPHEGAGAPFIEDESLVDGEIKGVVDIGATRKGDSVAPLVTGMLMSFGEDPEREGLVKTPWRVDQAWRYLTKGYDEKLEDIVNDAVFSSDNEEMVLVRNINIFSMCEHHMLPFYGRAHIAYVPDGRVIGISKLPRIAEMFARRLQIQEQLTQQIAEAVDEAVNPKGVAVVIECEHMCMVMRGIQKVGSITVTRALTGAFKEQPHLRQELDRAIAG